MPEYTVCRLCVSACGVVVHSEDGRLSKITHDPSDPVAGDKPCRVLPYVPSALSHPDRITQPLRRDGDAWVPVPWDRAVEEIGASLRKVRKEDGPESIGLYLGGDRWNRSRETTRALAFGVATGTPHVFSESYQRATPLLRAAELMLGHPAVLLSDLSRAHYVVVFDGGQPETGWGELRRGGSYAEALAHSVRTKGTKVVVVGPRRSPLADTAHQYVAIRPGTETFFALGMLSAAVKGGWRDAQFIKDYTDGWDSLAELLVAWPVERCAEICGVEAAQISGVALKFGRSAMAVAHFDERVWSSPHASVGGWVCLALHAITANLLRPGGLYDYEAPIDLHHPLALLPSEKAPETHSGHRLVALQAPASALRDHLDGVLRALIVVEGDPLEMAAAPDDLREGLGKLETLVVCARSHSETTALADWVLPVTHPFEEGELEVLGSFALPEPMVRMVHPAVQSPEDCWPTEHILRVLGQALRPGLRGGVHGLHLAMAGRHLLGADLEDWENRVLEWGADIDADALDVPPHRVEKGMADRSLWRISRENSRIDLVPDAIRVLLDALEPPTPQPDVLWLRTSVPRSPAPDVLHGRPTDAVAYVHPDTGHADGRTAKISTAHGSLEVTLHHDPRLRPDVVDIPREVPGLGVLLASMPRDPWTAMHAQDGLVCQIV